MPTPAPTTKLQDFLTQLEIQVADPQWHRSIEAKVLTLRGLKEFERWSGKPMFDRSVLVTAKALRITQARLRQILHLGPIEELRRALKVDRRPRPHRLPGEEIYPTEGWLGNYLLYAQGGEVPLGWHFWVGVAVIGAACRRNLYIDMNSFYLWPNHYLMLIGDSGTKKSQAIDTGLDVLTRLNRHLTEQGTDVEHRIRLLPRKTNPERFMQILCSEEVNMVERRADGGGRIRKRHTESVGVLANGELMTLLGKEAFHSSMLIGMLTELYNCPSGPWTNSTIGRGDEELRNVAISFIGGSTPDWIRDSVSEELMTGGFLGRCIVTPRKESGRSFAFPDPLDPVVAEALAQQLAWLCALPNREFELTPEWRSWYEEWYDGNKVMVGQCDPRMRGYYQRKGNHLVKLALIIALSSDGRLKGLAKDLEIALKIIDDEEKRLPMAFGELGMDEKARLCQRVYQRLYGNFGGEAAHTELLRSCHHFIGTARDFSVVIDTLKQQGLVKVSRDGTSRATYYKALVDPAMDEEGRS